MTGEGSPRTASSGVSMDAWARRPRRDGLMNWVAISYNCQVFIEWYAIGNHSAHSTSGLFGSARDQTRSAARCECVRRARRFLSHADQRGNYRRLLHLALDKTARCSAEWSTRGQRMSAGATRHQCAYVAHASGRTCRTRTARSCGPDPLESARCSGCCLCYCVSAACGSE